jgi:hypothetical protein
VPAGKADIKQHVFADLVGDDLGQHLPAVQLRVSLQEVVKAAIARNLELWARPKRGALSFCLADALQDAVTIA